MSAGLQTDIQTFTPSAYAKPDRYAHRLSLRPKFRLALSDSTSLDAVVFVRPRLDQISDIQEDAQIMLSNKLSGNVRLNISYEYAHESNPPSAAIAKTNTTLMFALSLKIG